MEMLNCLSYRLKTIAQTYVTFLELNLQMSHQKFQFRDTVRVNGVLL